METASALSNENGHVWTEKAIQKRHVGVENFGFQTKMATSERGVIV